MREYYNKVGTRGVSAGVSTIRVSGWDQEVPNCCVAVSDFRTNLDKDYALTAAVRSKHRVCGMTPMFLLAI